MSRLLHHQHKGSNELVWLCDSHKVLSPVVIVFLLVVNLVTMFPGE